MHDKHSLGARQFLLKFPEVDAEPNITKKVTYCEKTPLSNNTFYHYLDIIPEFDSVKILQFISHCEKYILYYKQIKYFQVLKKCVDTFFCTLSFL